MDNNINYTIIDNFLESDQSDRIEQYMCLWNDFPWFFNKEITFADNENENYFYFIHMFYRQFNISSDFYSDLVKPIVDKINPRALIRIKGNLYPNLNKEIQGELHTDYDFDHAGAIYYVNTNNGYTLLGDEVKIDSVKNRLLVFDPHVPHRSVGCTDKKCRVNINFNFF